LLRRSYAASLLAALGLIGLSASLVRAQQPPVTQPAPPASATGTIVGFVEDSLRGGPLTAAEVTLVGTDFAALTDLGGRFTFDGLPPGTYFIRVEHPFLDTLGIALMLRPVTLVAGQRLGAGASTPSLDAFRAANCPRGGVNVGPTMVFGRVLDADTEAPLANAAVSIVYRDLNALPGAAERVRQARSGANGNFAVCGLPESIKGSLQVSFGGQKTAEITFKNADSPIAAARVAIGGGPPKAVLSGRIIAANGAPVPEAQVSLEGVPGTVTSNSEGVFSMRDLPSGTQMMLVKKVGFAPVSRVVELNTREPVRLTFTMADAPQALAAVKVIGQMDNALTKVGFNERARQGLGKYIPPADVERLRPEMSLDLLREIPGFKVRATGMGRILESTRAGGSHTPGCVNVYVDRTRFDQLSPGDLDQAIPVGNIGAVEVYNSISSVPTEFSNAGRPCPTVVIWTKTRLGSSP